MHQASHATIGPASYLEKRSTRIDSRIDPLVQIGAPHEPMKMNPGSSLRRSLTTPLFRT